MNAGIMIDVNSDNVNAERMEQEMLGNWLSVTEVHHHAINVLRYQLPQAAVLVEDSVREMSSRFLNLSHGIKQQSSTVRQISELANTLEVGNESITLEEFTNLFSDTLSSTIDKIMFVSKRAITMVYMLDEAMKSIASIENFVGDIRMITKKANFLALNASIEAARAGPAGKGFSVVADEVKQVSETIRLISDSINERIISVGKNVRDGYEVLSDVATTDMSENFLAQGKLNTMMDSLLKQKQNFSQVLEGSAAASDEISQTILGLVMNLQFQDRNSQYMDSSINMLECLDKALCDLIEDNKRIFPELANVKIDSTLAERVASQLKLSEFSQLFYRSMSGVDFDSLTSSDNNKSTNSNLSTAQELEDIELF
jgi:methyl-accepting chemotaxis protein